MNINDEFAQKFKKLCRGNNNWRIWENFIFICACVISNSCDIWHRNEREREFKNCIKSIGLPQETAELFAVLTEVYAQNSRQDFLGKIFMQLGLNSHWTAQFFTPYHISELLAETAMPIKCGDFEIAADPACGSGSTLIAFANAYSGNYQTDVLFIGQDIDRVTGLMCYIQLSLLGCPGYVCIGSSLEKETNNDILFPAESEHREIWYTPMYFAGIWQLRQLCSKKKEGFIYGQGRVNTEYGGCSR